jgi:hypothetical protein
MPHLIPPHHLLNYFIFSLRPRRWVGGRGWFTGLRTSEHPPLRSETASLSGTRPASTLQGTALYIP